MLFCLFDLTLSAFWPHIYFYARYTLYIGGDSRLMPIPQCLNMPWGHLNASATRREKALDLRLFDILMYIALDYILVV